MPLRLSFASIADTSDRFIDFSPHVASINNDGVVVFSATLKTGESGIFLATDGKITTLVNRNAGFESFVRADPGGMISRKV